jgi:hypothetical protein
MFDYLDFLFYKKRDLLLYKDMENEKIFIYGRCRYVKRL